jgi:hypothetical protein
LINSRRWWSREERSIERRIYEKGKREKEKRKEETKLCHLYRFLSLD